MPKLNDTQTILLSTAAQRDRGSLYPLTDKLSADSRIAKAIASLLNHGFAEERETVVTDELYRSDGDLWFGVYATAAGLAAIGIEDDRADARQAPAPAPTPPTPRSTKAAAVLTLLQRDSGATLAELIAVTGWLPHTSRAALTGLRKKGHAITRGKRGDDTCYSITVAA